MVLALCRLILTNLSLTLEQKVASFTAYDPNYWMLLDEKRMNGSREIITTVHLNDSGGFNMVSIYMFH